MTPLSAEFWNQRYAANDTPWDLSGPTPEFRRLHGLGLFPKGSRVLVPGAGRGHDAVFLAAAGCAVDVVDIAPLALDAALESASRERAWIHGYRRDFFELPDTAYHQSAYDRLLEYTFFCAIDPALRARYVAGAARLLKPGGLLIGLFFPTASDKEPPPFPVSRTEVESLFRPYFQLQIDSPQASVGPRAGREFLGIFRRLPGA